MYVPCIMYHVSFFTYHVSCILYPASYKIVHVSIIVYNVSITGPMAIFDPIFVPQSEDGFDFRVNRPREGGLFDLRAEKLEDDFVLRAEKVEDGFVLRPRRMVRRSDRR